jgi:hypothetical protein
MFRPEMIGGSRVEQGLESDLEDRKPIGMLRRLVAVLLYLSAAAGAVFSVSGFLSGQDIRQRRADGDFAGAALLESFIVVWLLPLTLTALLVALALFPPARWLRRPATGAMEGPRPRRSGSLPGALGLVLFGIAYVAFVRYVIGDPFPRGSLFWVIFSPAILLLVALAVAAWRLARPRR